jgi:hypothetical protein
MYDTARAEDEEVVWMETIAQSLIRGGVFMHLILLVTVALLVFGVLHVILARKWSFIVTLILFALPPLLGAAGYAFGANMVEQALIGVSPEHREAMAAVGYAEAQLPLYFGLGAGGVGLVPLVIGEVRRRSKS